MEMKPARLASPDRLGSGRFSLMEILPFESLFGELAVRETRVIAVTESAPVGNPNRLPVDEYGAIRN